LKFDAVKISGRSRAIWSDIAVRSCLLVNSAATWLPWRIAIEMSEHPLRNRCPREDVKVG
jgi:hypothetical protein